MMNNVNGDVDRIFFLCVEKEESLGAFYRAFLRVTNEISSLQDILDALPSYAVTSWICFYFLVLLE